MTPRSYSTVEVGRRMGVSIQTVQRWVDAGHLKAWKTIGGHRRIDSASAEGLFATMDPERSAQPAAGPSAAELNAAVRAEILEMLSCTGRSNLLEAARTNDLVYVVDLLFTEMSDADAQAKDNPLLRERIAELEQKVADTHGPMQAQLAELNRRIITLTNANGSAAVVAELITALKDVISWVPGRAKWHTDAPMKAVARAQLAMAHALEVQG